MRLEDFAEVSRLVTELGTVEHQIREAEKINGTFVGISLGGTYQRDELLDRVRPVVMAHLQYKRNGILQTLHDLGIRQK